VLDLSLAAQEALRERRPVVGREAVGRDERDVILAPAFAIHGDEPRGGETPADDEELLGIHSERGHYASCSYSARCLARAARSASNRSGRGSTVHATAGSSGVSPSRSSATTAAPRAEASSIAVTASGRSSTSARI